MAAKRIPRCSKHKGGNRSEEDRISRLPDDIIILILSFLNLKDSVVTGILSRRWRRMWAWTSCLEFVAKDWVRRNKMHQVKKHCNRFVKGVNQVLRLHNPSTLEEFSVSYHLTKKRSHSIDEWLQFAIAKRVQRLKLDFQIQKRWKFWDEETKLYKLSYGMLGQTNGTIVGFESLKVLCLNHVDVTGKVLEGFLSSCPFLETLSITTSDALESFKVCDPSLVLKYLEISRCDNITSVEICNINLVSLIYRGYKIRWVLRDTPMLTELTIGGPAYRFLKELFTQLSCCLPQLETLTLETCDLEEFEGVNVPVELSNLKTLVLIPVVVGDMSFLGYTPLIKSSPLLQRFVLKAVWVSPTIGEGKIRRVEKFQHQHIEEVELGGYYGRRCDLELLMFFLENAVSLKKIMFDPRSYKTVHEEDRIKNEKAAKQQTLQQLEGIMLEGKMPQGLEIKIL